MHLSESKTHYPHIVHLFLKIWCRCFVNVYKFCLNVTYTG